MTTDHYFFLSNSDQGCGKKKYLGWVSMNMVNQVWSKKIGESKEILHGPLPNGQADSKRQ